MNISDVCARQILDSRGYPTVEADVTLANGTVGRAAVPSGASTGSHEAVELRDGGAAFDGKGVLKAVGNISGEIRQAMLGLEVSDQRAIDKLLIELDGTANKSRLGANAILAVSLAVAKAASLSCQQPLYQYFANLAGNKNLILPLPMINIINGGRHATGSTDIQEFMIMPVGATSFSQAVQIGAEVFHALGKILAAKGYATTVGDEGGYAPAVRHGNTEALELIAEAVTKAGYSLAKDIVLALDVAGSELFTGSHYEFKTEGKQYTSQEMVENYHDLVRQFPIVSIEDGLAEDDWAGWQRLTATLGDTVQLVGDDLLVTNAAFLRRAIETKAANAILIKLNQIGTLSETIDTVQLAHKAGWKTIISHRSGETEDTTIAHLAVGLGSGQIKTGSLSRSERVAKYNELLRIEAQLGPDARFAGHAILERQ